MSFFDMCCGGDSSRSGGEYNDTKMFTEFEPTSLSANDDASMELANSGSGDDLQGIDPRVVSSDTYNRYRQLVAEEEAKLLREHYTNTQGTLKQLEKDQAELDAETQHLASLSEELDRRESELRFKESMAAVSGAQAARAVAAGQGNPVPYHMMAPSTKQRRVESHSKLEEFKPYLYESEDESKASTAEEEIDLSDMSCPESLMRLGTKACMKKEYVLSKKYYKACMRCAANAGDETLIARAAADLANVYEILGRSAKALSLYKSSIALLNQNGNHRLERFIISNALYSFVRLKRYNDAVHFVKRELEILHKELPHETGEKNDADDDGQSIEQQIENSRDLLQILENALHNGLEVKLDFERVFYAVQKPEKV